MRTPTRTRLVAAPLALALAPALGGSGCTLEYRLEDRAPITLAIAEQAPLDVLFVVDNSASMTDEQQNLRRTVFDERCPITDLANVPEGYASPSGRVLEELVAVCGVAQLLAAFNADFHIGVITPDVGLCDERLPAAQDPEGLHTPTPQRGCLQGGMITSGADVPARFAEAIESVGTYGSPVERSMEATRIFLDPNSRRAPGCEDDLDGFLRPEAQLLVVYVTDEDDCSHDDGAYGFPNELAGEPACGEDFPGLFMSDPGACVAQPETLAPVQGTVDFLRGLVDGGRTRDVFVGVIGGVLKDDAGLTFPAGCIADGDVVTDRCVPSGGSSNANGPGQVCDAATTTCCHADPSSRLVDLARAVNDASFVGSACDGDYRATLLPLFQPRAVTTAAP
jgi:hypothetical protein